jgi:hypothetical protein
MSPKITTRIIIYIIEMLYFYCIKAKQKGIVCLEVVGAGQVR